MKIKNIEIDKFRAFKTNFHMNLGNNITAISGRNGVGKSTILGMIVNSFELKDKINDEVVKQLNGKNFKGEFGETVIYDEKHDIIGQNGAKYSISFDNLDKVNDNILNFRSTVQGEKRLRFIPKKKDNRKTESKVDWPAIYLGLSRIYPIGESKKASNKNISDKSITNELINIHSQLMNEKEIKIENSTFQSISISALSSKTKTGITTNVYSSTSNSSGQDTLGQIILAVLSFKKLKEQLKDRYSGGILAIDEIESTLHPSVQIKLIDWIYNESINLDLQIIFTTHSLTILNMLSKRRRKGVLINYLSKNSNGIKVKENPLKSYYTYDLLDTYRKFNKDQKINIYTEDEVARWFLDKVINYNPPTSIQNESFEKLEKEEKISRKLKEEKYIINYLEIQVSWASLISILTSDVKYFSNSIFLLDPDLYDENNYKNLEKTLLKYQYHEEINNMNSNLLILPGKKYKECIEKMLWDYLNDLDDDAYLWSDPYIENSGWTKERAINDGPFSGRYSKDESGNLRFKHWYNDNISYMEYVINYWILDNSSEVINFKNKLLTNIKKIKNKIELP